MKRYYFVLGALQAFTAIGAIPAGYGMLKDTNGAGLGMSLNLPFGCIGPSGMGRYHGRKSFETFSIMRSVMEKSNLIDIPVHYPHYTAFKEKMLRLLMR